MKSVVITGSSSGLGLALVKGFLNIGCKVYGISRSKTEIISENFIWIEGDINSPKDFIEKIDKVDILVNNAGYALFGSFLDLEVTKIKKQFNTNLFAQIDITKSLIPKIKESINPVIVNIGSMSGYMPTPLGIAYCGSKAGFNIISDIMKIELKSLGIKVVKVIPGVFQSKFGVNSHSDSTKDSHYMNMDSLLIRRSYISQTLKTDTNKYGLILAKKIIKTARSKTIYLGKGVIVGKLFLALLPEIIRTKILLKIYPMIPKED